MKSVAVEDMHSVMEFPWNGSTILYGTPNQATRWRVKTLLTKEPATIQWVSEIRANEKLLDIGANVGMYSLLAAVAQKAEVVAFEPESQNYAQLNRNIYLNKMQNRIRAFCLACSDESGFQPLYLSEFNTGSSCHSLGAEVGFDLRPRPSPFLQGSFSVTIDEAVFSGSIPIPNYIKIDVDGYEHKVLQGSVLTLSQECMKSVLIELNPSISEHLEAVRFMESLGYFYDPAQVASSAREEGPFKGVGEWIFHKRPTSLQTTKLFTVEQSKSLRAVERSRQEGQQILSHVINQIEKTIIDRSIFPISVVDNVFPNDYYQQMIDNFPSADSLRPLADTGRVGKNAYRKRLVLLFTEDEITRMPKKQQDFWRSLGSWLYSQEFINAIINYFGQDVMSRLHRIRMATGTEVRLQSDALLVSDQTNYSIGPHTDAPHRLVSFLFYLPSDQTKKHLGTSLYIPKNPEFTCVGTSHYQHSEFICVQTIEYLPNRLVMFPKSNLSFHGVEPITDQDPQRRLLINNIRLLDL